MSKAVHTIHYCSARPWHFFNFLWRKTNEKALEELVCLLRKKTQHGYERKCYYEFESVRRTMSI